MELQKRTYKKFSIFLTVAVVFLALLAVAAAHGNLVFIDRFAHFFSIDQDSSNKIVLSKTEFMNNSNPADSDSDKGGDGVSIQCFSPTFTGGVSVAVGDFEWLIHVERISLLTGVFDGGVGVVDSCEADAANKIQMLFDVRRNLRLTNDIVIEIPQNNTPESFQVTDYLRQAQASGTKIPVMKLIVADGRNQQKSGEFEPYLEIKMKEVLVTSYQTGTTASVPTDTFSVNFAAIKFEYKPTKED